MTTTVQLPLIIRGEVIEGTDAEFPLPGAGVVCRTPQVARYLDRLVASHSGLDDLYALRFSEVLDYLARLGRLLDFDDNPRMQRAYELARHTSRMSDAVLLREFKSLPAYFERARLAEMVARQVGAEYLDGWVEDPRSPGCRGSVRKRAFGTRAVHLIAGNVPTLGALTIVRNALTRSDALLKVPSNDPLTALAIAETMVEMEPEHPLTRHLSVAYWKGGDSTVEAALYGSEHIERIVAWGGSLAIRSASQHARPGVEVISFGPKRSISLIGEEAFVSDAALERVAERLAWDIGALDQEACYNSRVAYVAMGGAASPRTRACALAAATLAALKRMPEHISAPRKQLDQSLRMELEGLRLSGVDCDVVGAAGNEGAVIVSHDGTAVDFADSLNGRICNLVSVGTVRDVLPALDSSVQTVGVYPELLQAGIRDELALRGVQRVVSLGTASVFAGIGEPQDGVEPLRRLCKWVVDETSAWEAMNEQPA